MGKEAEKVNVFVPIVLIWSNYSKVWALAFQGRPCH